MHSRVGKKRSASVLAIFFSGAAPLFVNIQPRFFFWHGVFQKKIHK